VNEHRQDLVLADEPGIEVAAGSAGGQGVVSGVDVVRADSTATSCRSAIISAFLADDLRVTLIPKRGAYADLTSVLNGAGHLGEDWVTAA
jgi:hypothetical protein